MMAMLRMTPSRCRPIFSAKNRPQARSQVIVVGPGRFIPPRSVASTRTCRPRRAFHGAAPSAMGGAQRTGYGPGKTDDTGLGSLAMRPLTIALGDYGLTKPIKKAGPEQGRLKLN